MGTHKVELTEYQEALLELLKSGIQDYEILNQRLEKKKFKSNTLKVRDNVNILEEKGVIIII